MLCAILILQAALAGAGDEVLLHEQITTSAMGTELQIEVWGTSEQDLKGVIAAAVDEFRRVEDLMTDWRPSPLMTLNNSAGQGPQVVDAELFEVIGLGREISELSNGSFDMTFAAVGRFWDFKSTPPKLPTPAEIEQFLQFVDFRQILLNAEDRTVSLPENFQIGLGGIAKGHGVDQAMAVLMKHGIRHAIVNAGGDLKALGKNGNDLWEIAIKHPRHRERAIAILPVSNSCIVTSGDYERFFVHEGKRYHHIIDPRTGMPAAGCMSATVVGPDAAVADALATAMCVLGPEAGLPIIAALPRMEAILIDMDGKVHTSPGLTQHLK